MTDRNIPESDSNLLEEIRSILDLALNDTRRYMSNEMTKAEYDKVPFFKETVKKIVDVCKDYLNRRGKNKNLLKDVNEKIVKVLETFKEETPVVEIEEGLLKMFNLLKRHENRKIEPTKVELDDMIDAKRSLLTAFKIMPSENFDLVKMLSDDFSNGNFRNSAWQKEIETAKTNILPKLKDGVTLNSLFDDLWKDGWDSKLEAEMELSNKRDRHYISDMTETIRYKITESFI